MWFRKLFGKQRNKRKRERMLLEQVLEGESENLRTLVEKYFDGGHSLQEAVELAEKEQAELVERLVTGGEKILEKEIFLTDDGARKVIEQGLKEGKAALYDYEKRKKNEGESE